MNTTSENKTIFGKILRGEIPAQRVYETETVLAFRDIAPQAPTHIVVIPKKHIPGIASAQAEDTMLLGELLSAAREIAQAEGLEQGYRLVINQGADGGQTVHHLHLHILGGRAMAWPPG